MLQMGKLNENFASILYEVQASGYVDIMFFPTCRENVRQISRFYRNINDANIVEA